jgi:hypothetical protein
LPNFARVLVPLRNGNGNESLGPFRVRGTLFLETTCAKGGQFQVSLGAAGAVYFDNLCGWHTQTTLPNLEGRRISITISSNTSWKLAVGEQVKK